MSVGSLWLKLSPPPSPSVRLLTFKKVSCSVVHTLNLTDHLLGGHGLALLFLVTGLDPGSVSVFGSAGHGGGSPGGAPVGWASVGLSTGFSLAGSDGCGVRSVVRVRSFSSWCWHDCFLVSVGPVGPVYNLGQCSKSSPRDAVRKLT